MSESDESLLKAISHYQNGLERYMQRQDMTKMLHNLGRLYNLPIKVCHLEKTGVGRTVNSLRKIDGKVGDSAKSLVAKWKEMVLQEEDNKTATDCPSQEESHAVPDHMEDSQGASHMNTNIDRKYSDSRKSSSEKHHSSKSRSHSQSNSHEKKHKEKLKKRLHSSSEENSDDHVDTKNNSDSDNSENMQKIKLKQKERKFDVNSKDNHKSSRDSKSNAKHSSEDESEIHTSKLKKESKHESNDKKKHHHKSSHSRREETSKPKMKDDKKHDSSKHDKEKKNDRKERESKDRHEKHKNSKHDQTQKNDLQSSSSSISKKEKSEKTKSVKSAPPAAVINGIGSESGTSFEDALGMCGPPPAKKKKLSQERQRYTSPVHDEEQENNVPASVLPVPKEPLESLDINISSLLPPITPHYRPLGLPMDDQPKKMLTDDEALSRVMMNKNQRTKVYSGNKVAFGKVPTLFDMCVRVLQDNIDALEYTGGVPYSILKPILEKATANQLYMMEHHNPYLIDDTDELWKLQCQTEFRNKKKEEMETWRDMYMRCLDEREAKLRALTANIKQSQDKSLPVRTTKLAYVDSVAKPPRNIARKQAKNDTNSVRPSAKLATLATKGEAAKVSVPNPGARGAERSSGPSHPLKAKKAPLMAKTLTAYKNRFRR